MTTLHLIIICVSAIAVVAVVCVASVARAAVSGSEQKSGSRVGRRVTVHTRQPDDQTIHGVVVGDFEDRLSLENAEYVAPSGPVPISGRQDIPTASISWVDVHGQAVA